MTKPTTRSYSVEDEELLARLYRQGASYRQIASRLGVTKNVVAGRISRLALTRRVTLRPAPAPDDLRPRDGCRWPHGDPREPGFRFCDRSSQPGRPYCAEHMAVAYTKAKAQ